MPGTHLRVGAGLEGSQDGIPSISSMILIEPPLCRQHIGRLLIAQAAQQDRQQPVS